MCCCVGCTKEERKLDSKNCSKGCLDYLLESLCNNGKSSKILKPYSKNTLKCGDDERSRDRKKRRDENATYISNRNKMKQMGYDF